MTISSDTSAPLFVVVGSTGVQGRSVIKALQNSAKPYRIRAVTRNVSKDAAKELERIGCEVVQGDADDPASLESAFKGARYAFLMTNSDFAAQDVETGLDHEYSQGKNHFDAAVGAGTMAIVWAGLPDLSAAYNGKGKVDHFDIKARITAYGRSLISRNSAIKIIDVQPGAYLTNYIDLGFGYAPQSVPGSKEEYEVRLTFGPETPLPIVDMAEDYGKYVVGPLEWAEEGDASRWEEVQTVHAAPEYITPRQMAEVFSQGKSWNSSLEPRANPDPTSLGPPAVSRQRVTYTQIPEQDFYESEHRIFGPLGAGALVEMHRGIREVGFFGGTELEPSNRHLAEKARTFTQALEAYPESIKAVFGVERS